MPVIESLKQRQIESLARSVNTNRETLKIAGEVTQELDEQQVQIEQTIRQVDHIDRKVDDSDTRVGMMKSFTGHGFWYRFKKSLFSCCRTDTVKYAVRRHAVELKAEEKILREDAQ